jgi:hypothetical protein
MTLIALSFAQRAWRHSMCRRQNLGDGTEGVPRGAAAGCAGIGRLASGSAGRRAGSRGWSGENR